MKTSVWILFYIYKASALAIQNQHHWVHQIGIKAAAKLLDSSYDVNFSDVVLLEQVPEQNPDPVHSYLLDMVQGTKLMTVKNVNIYEDFDMDQYIGFPSPSTLFVVLDEDVSRLILLKTENSSLLTLNSWLMIMYNAEDQFLAPETFLQAQLMNYTSIGMCHLVRN